MDLAVIQRHKNFSLNEHYIYIDNKKSMIIWSFKNVEVNLKSRLEHLL